ncbi:MAG: aminopeptidase [Candidatus Shapirobacteria bacterium]|nr:aminopeptidase [Candidatus Shapirobacteria bacterium]MDD3003126.1 aminopeptidase [Candidatus Shapirobacteria bacterium]MDD4383182.1 aminopeptidase [Candidatus Shapirobacteria bacterium]
MYQPSSEILNKYADVLVNFALNNGRGVKKGEVVFLQVPESAKPLLISLQKSVLKAGAHAIIQYLPDEMSREFFELADDDQLKFFPATFLKGRVKQADHFLMVLAETNYHELEGIDPQKIMERNQVFKPYKDWRDAKENKGKLTWTIGLYATPAMSKEANLTLRQCWQQIIKACYLNNPNPVEKWCQIQNQSNHLRQKLNKLEILKVNIKAKDTDLNIGIGENRQWLGGDGNNIPSFEIFTSPDWRQTNGYIFFDQPLYRQGNLIKNIKLTFKDGLVVDAQAGYGEKFLKQLIKVENSDKIGEFSLTDKRFSKINKFMAETLYDENFGGSFGNTHIALGSSFKDAYSQKINKLTPKDWQDLGFNDSAVHTDIIATTDRTVTATLKNGQEIILYKSGRFQI